jgi:citrate synthase
MVWLMLRGDLPTAERARLLEAALVAGVDHGPQAPSISISRMAVTCGLPVNGAMASPSMRSMTFMVAQGNNAWN